jgi:hypothetical protein
MPVIEGKANFVHVKQTEEFQGKDTGRFSVLMTLSDTDAQTFENMGVRLKPFGEPPEQIMQRKFNSNFPVKLITNDGVDIRAVSDFIVEQQVEQQAGDNLDEEEALAAAIAAAVQEYGQAAVDLALAEEIPSGNFRVSFEFGKMHPVHGVPVYMNGIRILQADSASVDPAL